MINLRTTNYTLCLRNSEIKMIIGQPTAHIIHTCHMSTCYLNCTLVYGSIKIIEVVLIFSDGGGPVGSGIMSVAAGAVTNDVCHLSIQHQ